MWYVLYLGYDWNFQHVLYKGRGVHSKEKLQWDRAVLYCTIQQRTKWGNQHFIHCGKLCTDSVHFHTTNGTVCATISKKVIKVDNCFVGMVNIRYQRASGSMEYFSREVQKLQIQGACEITSIHSIKRKWIPQMRVTRKCPLFLRRKMLQESGQCTRTALIIRIERRMSIRECYGKGSYYSKRETRKLYRREKNALYWKRYTNTSVQLSPSTLNRDPRKIVSAPTAYTRRCCKSLYVGKHTLLYWRKFRLLKK